MFYPQFLYGLSRRRKKRFMMVCLASQVPSLCDQEGEIERHVISPHFCRRRINSDRPPDQQRTLNKVPTELRCRNFVAKHPLGIQIGAKRAKTFIQCVCFPTEIPFCIPPLVVGQEWLIVQGGGGGEGAARACWPFSSCSVQTHRQFIFLSSLSHFSYPSVRVKPQTKPASMTSKHFFLAYKKKDNWNPLCLRIVNIEKCV